MGLLLAFPDQYRARGCFLSIHGAYVRFVDVPSAVKTGQFAHLCGEIGTFGPLYMMAHHSISLLGTAIAAL